MSAQRRARFVCTVVSKLAMIRHNNGSLRVGSAEWHVVAARIMLATSYAHKR